MQFLEAFKYEHDDDVLIPPDVFLGLKWKGDRGQNYESVASERDYHNGKRIAIYTENSYVGTLAYGAMHWYGRIEVPHPSGKVMENGQWHYHGGYMGKGAPNMERLSLKVQRRLTKVERDMNDEVIGKVGDWTYRFNRPQDVKPAAIKLFKRKFAPGWVLMPESWEDGERPILAET